MIAADLSGKVALVTGGASGIGLATVERLARNSAKVAINDLADNPRLEQEVARLRAAGERIPGLGHPVFKKVDPRAAVLKQLAIDEGCWPAEAAVYEAVHGAFTSLAGKSDIPINDVGVMAAVLVGLEFSPAEGTGVAILSTMPGVVAHISEELTSRRPIRVVERSQVTYDVPPRDFRADARVAGLEPESTEGGSR